MGQGGACPFLFLIQLKRCNPVVSASVVGHKAIEKQAWISAKGDTAAVWIPALTVLLDCKMTAVSLTSRNLFFLEGEWLSSPYCRDAATHTHSLYSSAVSKELAVITLQGIFSKVE